jgi:glycosyltransferase involved in cell wall biosynthesis
VDGVSGFSFKPGDHSELADKILQLLLSPDLRERMSCAARERIVSEFTANQQIRNLSEILRETVNQSSGQSQWSKSVSSFLRSS